MLLAARLFEVARSQQSDYDAVRSLRSAVEWDAIAAQATLQWIQKLCNATSPSYETDRAKRILEAALTGQSPEPEPAAHSRLFELERELGWMPQEEAFSKLVAEVPELEALRELAIGLVDAPAACGISVEGDRVNVPAHLLPGVTNLVGPFAEHVDPLVRSPVAASVVSNYAAALVTGTAHLPLWDSGSPKRNGSLKGRYLPASG